MTTRREFLNAAAIVGAGAVVASTAKSYAQIVGSNERVNFAVIGLNSRAYAHLSSLKANALHIGSLSISMVWTGANSVLLAPPRVKVSL